MCELGVPVKLTVGALDYKTRDCQAFEKKIECENSGLVHVELKLGQQDREGC